MPRWACSNSVSKKDLRRAIKAFTMAVKKFNVGEEIEVDDGKGWLTPIIQIEIGLPSGLRTRAFKDESSVNLLQVATVIYNNELIDKPETGFGKAIVFLGNEKMEYDYRIHSVSFKPTMDLEDTQLFAELSSTDNKMIQRLVTDKVLSFYLSGKLTLKENEEVDTIVISKIVPHVDQTAYAKRFAEVKKKQNKFLQTLPDEIVKDEIFHDPNWDGVKMEGVAKVWKDFVEKHKKAVEKDASTLVNPPKPPPTVFDNWKKALKSKLTGSKT